MAEITAAKLSSTKRNHLQYHSLRTNKARRGGAESSSSSSSSSSTVSSSFSFFSKYFKEHRHRGQVAFLQCLSHSSKANPVKHMAAPQPTDLVSFPYLYKAENTVHFLSMSFFIARDAHVGVEDRGRVQCPCEIVEGSQKRL
ncbi:hypothetical protein HPP92_012070 [Vanilla planifolia]|uniref:Uncharacterized protein n=1 Tax=Vanilla planifolia TaxID=51239 RepID=A0A835V5M4_VANPL|nr:hypothetical protein HPP92_012070 [Vanilla planifolia]